MTKGDEGGEQPGRRGRTRLLRVRVTEGDLQRWQAAAAGNGVSNLSRWLRGVADQAAACGDDPNAWRRELARMMRDLNAGIGNNLNQIARSVAHADPDGLCSVALARMAKEFADLRRDVRAHLLGGVRTPRRASRRQARTGDFS